MIELEAALVEVATALDACGLAYVLIGGLAVALAGEPRTTLDVDVSVWTEPEQLNFALNCLCMKLRPTRPDYRALVEQHRVLPVRTATGTRADIIFAALPAERDMIRRGVSTPVGSRMVRVAALEDLIFMKLISEREKDLADARALLRRFKHTLDRGYLLPKIEEMAEALSRPDILATFRREAGS